MTDFIISFIQKMDLTKFELDKSIEKVKNFIKFFYRKNENYFLGKVLNDLDKDIPTTFFELESYYQLLKTKSTLFADDRDRTIEIAINNEISFAPKSILLAVVPTFYLDDEIFKSSLTDFAETVYDYPTTKANPNEFHGVIFDKVKTYLKESKLL